MKNNKQERWVDLIGYKGIYEVSTTGKVRNAVTKRVLSVQRLGTPAARVRLSRAGRERSVRVSTLVTLAQRAINARSRARVARSTTGTRQSTVAKTSTTSTRKSR